MKRYKTNLLIGFNICLDDHYRFHLMCLCVSFIHDLLYVNDFLDRNKFFVFYLSKVIRLGTVGGFILLIMLLFLLLIMLLMLLL